MGKFKMPSLKEFLKRKRIYGPKKDPVWVYLEREMQIRSKEGSKPYNNKVGTWLIYLKDLRRYFFQEYKRKYKSLEMAVGPPWYHEYTVDQRQILLEMEDLIRQDIIDGTCVRTKRALWALGISIKFHPQTLSYAIHNCKEDLGLFFWELFKDHYGVPPSQLMPNYDLNARILMSGMVFIDLEECIQEIKRIFGSFEKKEPPPPPKKKPKYYEPKCKFGAYLQKMYVPVYISRLNRLKTVKSHLDIRVKLHSTESYTRMAKEREPTTILERKKRKKIYKETVRKCNYKFWVPPDRADSAKQAEFMKKIKMFKKRARKSFLKYTPPYETIQANVANVSYSSGRPVYVLNGLSILPTGYILINLGSVRIYTGETITMNGGNYLYPRKISNQCDNTCDCLSKWPTPVFQYLEETKCKCGHRYDFYNKGKLMHKYIYPSQKNAPYWIDHAKIFQEDQWEDFVKTEVTRALKTDLTIPSTTSAVGDLKPKELLQAFLFTLTKTPLLIPHLPKAHLLNNLQAVIRKLMSGWGSKPEPKLHKKMLLQSQRRWADLSHIDFKARAYRIPFTETELNHFRFNHRPLVQTMFEVMLRDFEERTRKKLIEQTRLWWSTMEYDTYNGKSFLEVFYTYMPGRMKDVNVLNPYAPRVIPAVVGTCPLDKQPEGV